LIDALVDHIINIENEKDAALPGSSINGRKTTNDDIVSYCSCFFLNMVLVPVPVPVLVWTRTLVVSCAKAHYLPLLSLMLTLLLLLLHRYRSPLNERKTTKDHINSSA
jgi:hypothetical protein